MRVSDRPLGIQFWGVRGSLPSPGMSTAGVGGNTSCVEIYLGDQRIILDAGTGIRELGESLKASGPLDAALLLSHLHWDHIQGFPFFEPLFDPASKLRIYGNPEEGSIEDALRRQMAPPTFPITLDKLPAQLEFAAIDLEAPLLIGDFTVRAARLNHPNSVLAYRIDCGGCSVVYATDTEHYADRIDESLIELAKDADVLIYDSMFTDDEYQGLAGASRQGWGHSTWQEGIKVADAANVEKLILFHHDPRRSDSQVGRIEAQAAAIRPGTVAARENMRLMLNCKRERKAA